MTLTAGEVCAGYGGLALAVEEVFGARTAWFSEFDAAPSKILKHHWPDIPNHGDMTAIDWASIEQVDIISGGTPCQDLSHAGRRKGMTEGTRSNLWVNMREAIAIQKPKWVVWENVRGAYSAEAHSDVEFCPGCMGDARDGGVILRALGRVLGDLSDLGYDTEWRGLRASDVGACHARFRVFVLARLRAVGVPRYSNGADVEGFGSSGLGISYLAPGTRERGGASLATENPDRSSSRERRKSAPGQEEGGRAWSDAGGRDRTPASDAAGARCAERQDRRAGIGDAGQGAWGVEPERAGRERADAATDAISIGCDGRAREAWREEGHRVAAEWTSEAISWGDYELAIRRWERVLGCPAPRPTEPTGRDGAERLSPRFTEWMMGLVDGWVTAPAIGITRNEQLKACGNGVVPQQAIAALRDMLAAFNKSLDLAA